MSFSMTNVILFLFDHMTFGKTNVIFIVFDSSSNNHNYSTINTWIKHHPSHLFQYKKKQKQSRPVEVSNQTFFPAGSAATQATDRARRLSETPKHPLVLALTRNRRPSTWRRTCSWACSGRSWSRAGWPSPAKSVSWRGTASPRRLCGISPWSRPSRRRAAAAGATAQHTPLLRAQHVRHLGLHLHLRPRGCQPSRN